METDFGPQFGTPEPGRVHRDRPAAFGLALQGEMLALVRVTYPEKPPFFDLPGGALDAGENADAAMIREFGEETGLIVSAGGEVARASQQFLTKDGEAVNNRCIFLRALVDGANPRLKIEQDHELVWMSSMEALRRLRHEAHAWGLAAWLRSRHTDVPSAG
jgi:8-oxo-dGTP diphosphatase